MATGVNVAIAVGTTIVKIAAKFGVSIISVVIYTDFFSFYECLIKLRTTKKKRLMINIMAIRQVYKQQDVLDIRWINGRDNPANVITKGARIGPLNSLLTTTSLLCAYRNRLNETARNLTNERNHITKTAFKNENRISELGIA
jgi:hypothetical protein